MIPLLINLDKQIQKYTLSWLILKGLMLATPDSSFHHSCMVTTQPKVFTQRLWIFSHQTTGFHILGSSSWTYETEKLVHGFLITQHLLALDYVRSVIIYHNNAAFFVYLEIHDSGRPVVRKSFFKIGLILYFWGSPEKLLKLASSIYFSW